MDFTLTEEQKMIQKTARDFARNELMPLAAQIDKEDKVPPGIRKRMADLGFFGVGIPKEYGGVGGDYLSRSIVAEELCYASAGTGLIILASTGLALGPILKFGTEEQKKRYVPALAKGEKLAAFVETEPDVGSNPAEVRTTAIKDGDEYIINGNKVFITNGDEASVFTVLATTDRSLGARGLCMFIVEKGTPGLSIGPELQKLGIHGSTQTDVYFNDCRVPAANIIEKEGMGLKVAFGAIDSSRIEVAAQAIGIAQAAFDAAFDYAEQRMQFARPIIKFQAIQWMLVDMLNAIEAARLLTHKAACLEDQKKPFFMEAARAKLMASEMSHMVTHKAIQIFGGNGYCTEYPVERFMRDARITEIYEGTSEMQRLTLIRNMIDARGKK